MTVECIYLQSREKKCQFQILLKSTHNTKGLFGVLLSWELIRFHQFASLLFCLTPKWVCLVSWPPNQDGDNTTYSATSHCCYEIKWSVYPPPRKQQSSLRQMLMNELSRVWSIWIWSHWSYFYPCWGCSVFKLAPGEFKVHPQPKSDSGNLHFLPANVCQTKSEASHSRALARAEKAEASEPISPHSIILNSRLTFQRSPLMGAAGEETVRGGSFG